MKRVKTIFWLACLYLTVCAFFVKAEGEQRNDRVGADGIPGIDLDFPASARSLHSVEGVNQWLQDEVATRLGLMASDRIAIAGRSQQLNGYTIYPVVQSFQGKPVDGHESRLVTDKDGVPLFLMGRHNGYGAAANSEPLIPISKALENAGHVEETKYQHELVYWRGGGEKLILVYKIEGQFDAKDAPGYQRVYVDTESGDIIRRVPLLHSAMNRKVYNFKAACEKSRISTPVPPLVAVTNYARLEGQSRSGNDSVDSIYDLLEYTYQFINAVYGLDSLDNAGIALKVFANVHYHQLVPGSIQCVGDVFNAAWVQPTSSLSLTADAYRYVEVVAHELGHGIIGHGSGLVYENESGALNESIADSIGVGFRGWYEFGNKSPNLPQIANDLWRIRGPDGDLRNMMLPKLAGQNYPDHYEQYARMQADYGGVHVNSSIMNVGFYLLSQGGQHPRLKSGQSVAGIGLINATRIYALAGASVLTSHSNFADARCGFAHIAELQHGKNSAEWKAVHHAMDAIGIPNLCAASPAPQAPVPAPAPPLPEPDGTSVPAPQEQERKSQNKMPGDDASGNSKAVAIALLVGLAVAGFALLRASTRREADSIDPSYRADGHSKSTIDNRSSAQAAVDLPRIKETNAPIVIDAKPKSRNDSFAVLVPLDGSEPIPLTTRFLKCKEGLVIGRALDLVHVEMNSEMVSRRHCRLKLRESMLFVEDLNSSHGTSLESVALKPFEAKQFSLGQIISIAGYSYVLKDRRAL